MYWTHGTSAIHSCNNAKPSADEFRSQALLPANEAYRDPVRKELDAALWDCPGPAGDSAAQLGIASEPVVCGAVSARRQAHTPGLGVKPVLTMNVQYFNNP